MDDPVIRRIERAAGVPGLLDVLDRMPATDLQSLLLAAHRRRAARVTPAGLLDRYRTDRFAAPATTDPRTIAAFEVAAFGRLSGRGYVPVELSPVAPLGTVSAVATVDQNKVVSTGRTGEVVADATNVLALESAVRRRDRLRVDPRDAVPVRLCTSHRLVRAQDFGAASPHFRLLGVTLAGRDVGSHGFERAGLIEVVDALLEVAGPAATRAALTDLGDVDLSGPAIAALRTRHPDVAFDVDAGRTGGRGYYVDACFHVYAADGTELADGGFTTWTRQLLGNAKERLLIGALGVEHLLRA